MKSTLTCFVAVLSIYFIEADKFRCDYVYIYTGGGWFKFHDEEKTYDDARTVCQLEGAVLAWPKDRGMNETMLYLLAQSDAAAILIEKYSQDENDTTEDEHQVMLRDGSEEPVFKNSMYPYICYKDAGPSVTLNECGTLDDAYALDNRTGSCYKYHQVFSTWDEALFTCSVEGGYLAVINSGVEAQAIRDIFARNPKSTDPAESWKDGAFIGFRLKAADIWYTVTGQPLKDAGYDIFSPGEPNNARGDEYCGSVARNGKLVDDPCDRTLPFICEKRPDRTCTITDAFQSPDMPHYVYVRRRQSSTNKNNEYEIVDSKNVILNSVSSQYHLIDNY
ncbi:uncharacterized protein LOC126368628 [Pectinophora gossypiella]|uniref:uncharacterized protein LOC126368628 n=1 Tax=Pectinophora gossypiella TaxID=13191 RepID=UPI00214F0A57|nr:uncharacterized protein LOC126368628 [Pectinophora gossypiella]